MFYSPIVEIIEKLIKKANDYGSHVYWGWTLLVGIFGGLFVIVFDADGWNAARPLLIISLVVFFGGIYPVSQYEKCWKNKKDKR